MNLKPLLTAALLLPSVLGLAAEAADLDDQEQALVDFIDQNNPAAQALLVDIININSGSMNFTGVRAVADVLIPEFAALRFDAGFIDGEAWNRAGHLVARHPVEGASPKLLLIGHLDTVFEPDSPESGRSFERC